MLHLYQQIILVQKLPMDHLEKLQVYHLYTINLWKKKSMIIP
jgi:hypothetical protein